MALFIVPSATLILGGDPSRYDFGATAQIGVYGLTLLGIAGFILTFSKNTSKPVLVFKIALLVCGLIGLNAGLYEDIVNVASLGDYWIKDVYDGAVRLTLMTAFIMCIKYTR